MSIPRLAIPLLALLVIPACARTHELGLGMNASQEAVFLVMGDQPFVTVENDGPGTIEVQFFGEDSRRRLQAGTATGSSVVAPINITLRTGIDGDAEVRVIAKGADSIGVEALPLSEENTPR